MSHKTIDINPALFIITSSKTKKNKERKLRSLSKPLISPNILKNKLLKRIKDHKIRETENLENNKKKISDFNYNDENYTNISKPQLVDISYTDEFNDSIDYLQTLSKQKKINDEKINYDKIKQRNREELERKTVKNYQSMNYSTPYVNIDLPEELTESFININTEKCNIDNQIPINLIRHKDNQVPYGVLKGGLKPTYRDWTKTQRNLTVNPQSLIIDGNKPVNKNITERELRLNSLKEKIQQTQLQQTQLQQSQLQQTQLQQSQLQQTQLQQSQLQQSQLQQSQLQQTPIDHNFTKNNPDIIKDIITTQNLIQRPMYNDMINVQEICVNPTQVLNNQQNNGINQYISKKRIIKKTIRRKYTLGKSAIKKSVAILLKDRCTRKKVLVAIKELKKYTVNDIKIYLKNHNLIKIGSNAPNDVLRKMYESAILAGEITNSNSDILLYNLMKDDIKEL